MSKNVLIRSLSLSLIISLLSVRSVFADIAPDPFVRKPSLILVLVLIVSAVLICVFLIRKFFQK